MEEKDVRNGQKTVEKRPNWDLFISGCYWWNKLEFLLRKTSRYCSIDIKHKHYNLYFMGSIWTYMHLELHDFSLWNTICCFSVTTCNKRVTSLETIVIVWKQRVMHLHLPWYYKIVTSAAFCIFPLCIFFMLCQVDCEQNTTLPWFK